MSGAFPVMARGKCMTSCNINNLSQLPILGFGTDPRRSSRKCGKSAFLDDI